ncbi:Biomphalysin 23 [Biomphalaria pfeifferi]|uniref:Biomphalysin 23 n=1 Tax=Biomphalaria pfeifferi TaxID=112525 RepID=A0AAD8C1G4_BIOPF|nr:Biomphalysin 23 [Biomphalaria pfeifferi]
MTNMLLSKLRVFMALLGVVKVNGMTVPWSKSNRSDHQVLCKDYDSYVVEFGLNHTDALTNLESAKCEKIQRGNSSAIVVEYVDWNKKIDKNQVWLHCPSGFFLQGMQILLIKSTRMLNGRCCKPAKHPFYYLDCNVVEVTDHQFNFLLSCPPNYFVTALHKSRCGNSHCFDKIYCCLLNKEEEDRSSEEIKQKIMENSLTNLATLANMLGYAYPLGARGINVGEDFHIEGNSWVANKQDFNGKECRIQGCDERLTIEYNDWSLAVKDIIYGDKVIDNLSPEAIHSGVEYNHMNTSSTKTFEFSKTISETIVHSITSSFTTSAEMSVSLDFGFKSFGGSVSLTVGIEHSTTSSSEDSKMKSVLYKASTTHTIPPQSAAKYSAVVSKVRTTIPYTAVIVARFSVKFVGYLRSREGVEHPNFNFHYLFSNIVDTNRWIPFTFGDTSEPFQAALQRANQTKCLPWLWNEIKQNYNNSIPLINELADENQYAFTLSGKLEHVAGSKIDVIWKEVRLHRRSTYDELGAGNSCPNRTYIAKAGPSDKPAKVNYPKINIPKAKPSEIKPTLAD